MAHQRSSTRLSHDQIMYGDGGESDESMSDVGGGGGDGALKRKWSEEQSEITLILPHSQLTRPGDWRYDTTPLKSHDWQSGCQRIRIFDGRPEWSRMAHDRIGEDTNTNTNNSNTWKDPWKDMEPHRSTAAVIGILNMRDCQDTRDLWRAEEELIRWSRKYANEENREDIVVGAGDRGSLLTRLFVFDSFEESIQQRVNLSQTRFHSSQLVAFPPLDVAHSHMMALHWNVVVNDLAVALFRMMERRIRENDAMGKSVWKLGGIGVGAGAGAVGVAGVAALLSGGSGVGGSESNEGLSSSSSVMGDSVDGTNTTTSQTTGVSVNTSNSNIDNSEDSAPRMGVGGRFKNALDMTRKAIVSRQESASGSNKSAVSAGGVSAGGQSAGMAGVSKLVTPLDLDARDDAMNSDTTFSARDLEALKRRDLGRREKRSADLVRLLLLPPPIFLIFLFLIQFSLNGRNDSFMPSCFNGCHIDRKQHFCIKFRTLVSPSRIPH